MVSQLGWDVMVRCGKCGQVRPHCIDALPFEGGGLTPLDMECAKCGRTRHTITRVGGPVRR